MEQPNKGTKEQRNKGTNKQTRSPGLVFRSLAKLNDNTITNTYSINKKKIKKKTLKDSTFNLC